jgi:23S rRNA U2552 (ribose-2'-O)-methylase RlmE/FtsJ
MTASLSGKVSPEALAALQALMTKHKTKVDVSRSNTGTTLNKTVIQAEHDVFKNEMDALFTQYPELKSAMPTMGK